MKEAILGIMRHALTTIGGSAMAAGYLGADEVSAGVGAIITLAGIAMSVYAKRKAKK